MNNKKEKIGKIIYFLAPSFLFIYVVLILFSKELPNKSTNLAVFGLAFLVSTGSSILTNDVGIRGVGAIKKKEKPKLYYFQIVLQLVIGLAFIILAIML